MYTNLQCFGTCDTFNLTYQELKRPVTHQDQLLHGVPQPTLAQRLPTLDVLVPLLLLPHERLPEEIVQTERGHPRHGLLQVIQVDRSVDPRSQINLTKYRVTRHLVNLRLAIVSWQNPLGW